ncbi:LytR C-terminal domain-containing protein [Streptomyces sp. JJ36]|uniref:LytR C-terminal domain-containing protein n=1 Tax=Streptomyces sp. JJ36 TaxID=2736645 RepID=UPI001F46F1DF|nr:LytR C-terminal domain-containing protein [Streptomyces sp. JJ36]MCF6525658.1 LytR C-terminal domain-containing protein [Streptomyces sp. JJ36]
MSMLTPPGMGGQYRIKGDRYPRMRRPRRRGRIVSASMAAALALGLIGWGTLQLVDVFTGEGAGTARAADPDDTCRTSGDARGEHGATAAQADGSAEPAASASALPRPGKITVNVLNATPRSGLAARTAKALKKRGFTVGEVANAPASLDKKVKVSALLMGATGAETIARLKVLGTQVEGAETRYDDRKGTDVDLVLGDAFDGLAAERTAQRAMAALASPSPKPSPSC